MIDFNNFGLPYFNLFLFVLVSGNIRYLEISGIRKYPVSGNIWYPEVSGIRKYLVSGSIRYPEISGIRKYPVSGISGIRKYLVSGSIRYQEISNIRIWFEVWFEIKFKVWFEVRSHSVKVFKKFGRDRDGNGTLECGQTDGNSLIII